MCIITVSSQTRSTHPEIIAKLQTFHCKSNIFSLKNVVRYEFRLKQDRLDAIGINNLSLGVTKYNKTLID